jgi:hypothetical protein
MVMGLEVYSSLNITSLEATIFHLRNLAAISIGNINTAVADEIAKRNSNHKSMQDYFKDLVNIRYSEPERITSTTNVSIIVLTLIAIQFCYCMFKIGFAPSHITNTSKKEQIRN